MPIKPIDPSVRFWRHVEKSGDCWLWTGAVCGGVPGHRYGSFIVKRGPRKGRYAHRFSYRLHIGDIPDGMHVCHTCDNPLCVRPDHLFVGTQADNNRDCRRKNRHARGDGHGLRKHPDRAARGERQGRAKLTAVAVVEMRRLRANEGLSWNELARRYGVTGSTARSAVIGETWRHLQDTDLQRVMGTIDQLLSEQGQHTNRPARPPKR